MIHGDPLDIARAIDADVSAGEALVLDGRTRAGRGWLLRSYRFSYEVWSATQIERVREDDPDGDTVLVDVKLRHGE